MYEYKCEVTRVVDGDTIDVILDLGFKILHKARVRLFGIDTPESRTRDKDEKVRGKMASKFLQEAIDSGSVVTTEIMIPQERPNRKRKSSYGGTSQKKSRPRT